MTNLTKATSQWIKDVQGILNQCPSIDIGICTMDDNNIVAYDLTKRDVIYEEMDLGRASDFGPAGENVGVLFHEELWFPQSS